MSQIASFKITLDAKFEKLHLLMLQQEEKLSFCITHFLTRCDREILDQRQ